jgi:hypothetical protein
MLQAGAGGQNPPAPPHSSTAGGHPRVLGTADRVGPPPESFRARDRYASLGAQRRARLRSAMTIRALGVVRDFLQNRRAAPDGDVQHASARPQRTDVRKLARRTCLSACRPLGVGGTSAFISPPRGRGAAISAYSTGLSAGLCYSWLEAPRKQGAAWRWSRALRQFDARRDAQITRAQLSCFRHPV